jgi:hypothetical protein
MSPGAISETKKMMMETRSMVSSMPSRRRDMNFPIEVSLPFTRALQMETVGRNR